MTPTLESVRRQTFSDFECIVVDDGGKDDTSGLVREMRDDRFVYTWKTHGERGAARNHGTRLARGRYVYFLDSDDLLLPGALAAAKSEIDRNGTRYLVTKYEFVSPAGQVEAPAFAYEPFYRWRLFLENVGGGCCFLERDLALSVPFVEDLRFSFGEDWDLALRVSVRETPLVLEGVWRHVLRHSGSTMGGVNPERVMVSTEILLASLRADEEFVRKAGWSLPFVRSEMLSLAALHFSLRGDAVAASRLLLQSGVRAWRPGRVRRIGAIVRRVVGRPRRESV